MHLHFYQHLTARQVAFEQRFRGHVEVRVWLQCWIETPCLAGQVTCGCEQHCRSDKRHIPTSFGCGEHIYDHDISSAHVCSKVASHGAGIANIIFCPERVLLLEFALPSPQMRYYAYLAVALGLVYEPKVVDPNFRSDLVVDVDSTVQTVLRHVQSKIEGFV